LLLQVFMSKSKSKLISELEDSVLFAYFCIFIFFA